MDLSVPFAFGFKIADDWNPAGTEAKYTIVRNGQNAFYMRNVGTGNASPYFENGPSYQGGNAFVAAPAGSRIVISYNGAGTATYYLNGTERVVSFSVANLAAADNSDGTVTIGQGKQPGQQGWSTYLDGGIDEMWFADRAITQAEASESAAGGDPAAWSFYDDITDFLPLGEGTFPTVEGVKGVLIGTLENGEPGDFTQY